MIVHNNP